MMSNALVVGSTTETTARQATSASFEQRTVRQRPKVAKPRAASEMLQSPQDVLYSNEISRSRVWVLLCAMLALAGLIASVVVSAPLPARLLLAIGSSVHLVAVAIAWWVLRDERRYTRRLTELFCYVSIACLLTTYYFCGWASGVALLMPLGGILFGLHQERRTVVRIAAVTCGSHAALAVATIFGWVDDRAFFAGRAAYIDQFLLLGLVQVVTLSSFAIGQQLRGHFLDAVERYGAAVRDGARRAALLQEALLDLAVARQGGQAGRFTGMELGEFRLGAVIGRGGMGEVYDAERASGGAPVAIKVVTAAGASNDRAMKRFDREIRIAASIESVHVARVVAHSAPHDPVKYLAMERLIGASLSDVLRGGTMPVREALEMLRQVAIAVDIAHGAGIVHRDLKPGNVFRHDAGPAPLWKVLDFGVSKLTEGGGTLTADAIIGTTGYMAPEQASGADVGPRADIFALGAIAYRVLVGRPAFGGRDLGAALYAVVHGMPPRPSLVAAVPPDVDAALAIALAKSPGDRYASAHELVEAVTHACRASLLPELRRRGASQVEKHPWSSAA